MSGRVHVENDRVVPGPYLQHVRREWLAEILRAQRHVEANGPKDIGAIELITLAEIEEIRRIWVVEKNEVEDLVPTVWEEVYGTKYPGAALDDGLPFGAEELAILEELCGGDRLHYEMVRDLLCIEQRSGTTLKRGDLFTEFERAISKAFYSSPEDAVERARAQVSARDAAQARPSTLLDPVGCVEEARDDDDLEGNNAADEAILEVLA
jgi:DNA sulfur modification protein DndC